MTLGSVEGNPGILEVSSGRRPDSLEAIRWPAQGRIARTSTSGPRCQSPSTLQGLRRGVIRGRQPTAPGTDQTGGWATTVGSHIPLRYLASAAPGHGGMVIQMNFRS
jgi:hypothetical protein